MPRANKNAIPVLKLDSDLAGALAVPESTEISLAFDECIQKAKEQIKSIDEKAEFAIQVVTQSIRTQAAVAKGQVLLALRERFDQVPALEGKWAIFLDDIGLSTDMAFKYMNSSRAVAENSEALGEDFLLTFPVNALHTIQTLPAVVKEAVLEDAAETGEAPSVREIAEISKDPRTKLAKAMESLEAVAERKADPERTESYSLRYDKKQEAKLEETIEMLKSQIAEDKIKSEMEAKEKERISAELELLKYDDEAAREQRVKRVSNTLIISIPAVLSDLQKYIAEKEHYDSKTTKSLDGSIQTLIHFLKPLYA